MQSALRNPGRNMRAPSGGNAGNESVAGVPPAAGYSGRDDTYVLSLLAEEIQDDQMDVITEGLHMQDALLNSLMTPDSAAAEAIPAAVEETVTAESPTLYHDHAGSKEDQEDWNYLRFCELCAQVNEEDLMTRVLECGHQFCLDCFIDYASLVMDSDERSIICPAKNCSYVLEYDFCVASNLQYLLDNRKVE